MSYFNNLVLTTKGQEMLLSSNANIDKIITFTSASLGSEKLLPEEIKKATEVKKSWIKIPLNTVRVINDENNYFLRTEIAFTNAGITENKLMRELGIYAKFESENEVLFAYSVTDDDGETIPKEDIVPATYKFTIDATISTETKINQTINPEGFLTKEVVELLKYYIANIAVQRFKGVLTAGQTVININSEGSLLTTLSKRLQLFIGGELYSEGIDYTINTQNNTIYLSDELRFEEGTVFEVIDNLPPGYVKELLDEFFSKVNEKESEVLGNLEIIQRKNIEAIKILSKQISDFLDEKNVNIIENLDKKIEDFYIALDTYIENNKEKLKGKSLYQSWLDIGNIGSESDFVNAMKIKGDDGNPGRGIVNTTIRKGEGRKRIITIFYTDDTTTELEIEDGKSAYEVWKSMGNPGTEIDFFKSLQGASIEYTWRGTELGIRVEGDIEYSYVDLKGTNFKFSKIYSSIAQMEADFSNEEVGLGEYVIISSDDDDNAKLFEKRLDGFFFIGQMAMRGKSAYEIWLELGNEGTEENFINSLKGVGVVDREFVRVDAEGNYVYRDIYSDGTKSSEYISPRGPRGYTGGVVGEPQPPGSVPYGTIVEWAGDLPEGWLYTNGGILDKRRYPHMSFLPGTTQPQEPYFKLDESINFKSNGRIVDGRLEMTIIYPNSDILGYLRQDNTDISDSKTYGAYWPRLLTNVGAYGKAFLISGYFDIELPEKLSLSFMSMDKINATGNSHTPTGTTNKNVDIYIVIEYMDENGDWIKGVELHNKTDFIPPSDVSDKAIAMIKSSFKSNKFRFYVDSKSLPNFPTYGMYYVGKLAFAFDKSGTQYNDYVQLPNEKDNQGRYKIIYVGQPLEIQESTMYSYNVNNNYNGEVPLSIAVENKLPNYVEGITMTEPQPLRMGYTNKYNNATDTWELVKSHENEEGYYYDVNGELKHIHKPFNWYKWDLETHTWIENDILKEETKNKLLNEYIELELKKDKMLELKLSTENIEKEIEKVKKELEAFNE